MGKFGRVLNRGVERPMTAVWSPYLRRLKGSTGETNEKAADNLDKRHGSLDLGSNVGSQEKVRCRFPGKWDMGYEINREIKTDWAVA